jgi:anthranilate synthase component 1
LDRWWLESRTPVPAAGLPFTGGWFLFLAYELASEIETTLELPRSPVGVIARAVRIPAAIVRRHSDRRAWITVESTAAHLIEQILADLRTVVASEPVPGIVADSLHEEDAQHYADAVSSALEHIAAGEIYQSNLSREWHGSVHAQVQPYHIYRRLRAANPAPFAGIAAFQDHAIVSSSPERLLEIRNGIASTRPIAGTRPRSRDEQADAELARELRAHPKEQAEHIMLIDLERNDLGRICDGGTVQVDEFMSLESYAHVHHIVSNVRGRLRAGVTPGEAIRAVFPGGTITGCPKVRCMQLIADLERTPRGAYTGSMGYLNRDGSLDLNILIRTLEIDGQSLKFRAGAGIVADSDPVRELEETRAKARGLVQALHAAPES